MDLTLFNERSDHLPERPKRWERYASASLLGVTARVATTDADLLLVASLREQGFGRMLDASNLTPSWLDASDSSPGTFSLLGTAVDGTVCATMKIQDGRHVRVELESRVKIEDSLLPSEYPVAQFSRLSVLKHPDATSVMFGLFKAAWSWCKREGIKTIVIATPAWSRPIYEFMLFEKISSDFKHELAGGALHSVMKLPVQTAELVWRSGGQQLSGQFFDIRHPNLEI